MKLLQCYIMDLVQLYKCMELTHMDHMFDNGKRCHIFGYLHGSSFYASRFNNLTKLHNLLQIYFSSIVISIYISCRSMFS